jgi:hypothetical protein
MKILNYSTLSLLFTTIIQAVFGYTCPNVALINRKITQNDLMRFPLAKGSDETGREIYFQYRASNNKIEKFYRGKSKVDKFTGVYYHPQKTPEMAASLTCTYQQKNNRYLLLPMTERGAKRISGAAIENEIDSNWRVVQNSSFFVCGNGEMAKENLDNCQFFLNSR